jgi:type I restriction enzyme, S subunit
MSQTDVDMGYAALTRPTIHELSENDIPAHWQEVNLVDFCHPKQWKTISTSQLKESGYIVYGANGKIGFYNEYTHENPTLMITCRGATCGNLHISEPFSYINGNAMALDNLVENQVLQKYLLYALKARGLEDAISGSAQPQITRQGLATVKVLLPPLAEQQQIADKLDELLEQVDIIKTRLDLIPKILKRFRQSVLAAAVSGKITEGWRNSELISWKQQLLENLVKKPNYGTSAKSQKEGKVPVLRMGNLQNGKLDWNDLVYSSDEEEIHKYRLYSGDVLFNRTNSPELVGKTSIYRGEREAIFAGYLIRVQCSKDLKPEFLNIHLNSPLAREFCQSVKSDGVSQSNINAQKLLEYPIHCPPISEQTEIVNRVEQLFA